MDEFEVDVLDVVRLARPGVDGADDEALARLRATILGEFSSPADDNSPKFEPALGAPGPVTTNPPVAEDETGGEVLELAVVGGRRPSRWRAVALVAAAAILVAGLTTVAIARRSAPVAGGEGWVPPTADNFAPSSQYQVTRLVDGTTDVPFGVRLTIGLLDPPPGAGLLCTQNLLPPGIGDGGAVVSDGRVAQWAPCHLVDPPLIAFLDALMGAHPAVEVRGDELRLRAGARELDAARPTTVDPSALAWMTPSLEQLAGSTYAMADQSHLVTGALGPVGAFDLTFDQDGFAVAVLGCGVASARATIAAGHLAVSAFTAGTNVAGYTPVGGRSCALADLLSAIAKARPTIEVRADQLRLQADSIDLQGTKTAGVNASAIEVWQVPTLEQLVGHQYKVSAVIDDGTSQDLTAYVSFGPDAVHISACPKFWLANHPTIVDGRLSVEAPGPDPIVRLVDCLLVPTDHLDALVRLVAANPTIEVRGGLLRLTAGTTSVIGVEPGAVDPGSGPVVTAATAAVSPVDATTLPAVAAPAAPSAPHTPSIDELVGNEYVIDRLSIAGVDQPLTGSPPIRFASDETGMRLSTGACNAVTGYVEVVGDRLASAAVDLGDGRGAGPVWERTLVACDAARMAVDDALYAFLPTDPAISVSGDRLTLTSGVSTVVAHRRPPVALVGTTWTYQGIRAATPVGPVTSYAGLRATVAFGGDAGDRWTYGGPCQQLGGGTFSRPDARTVRLAAADYGGPAVACPRSDQEAAEEQRVRALLDGALTVAIADRTLTLTAADGSALTFVAF